MASKTVEQAAPRHERNKNPKGLYYEPAVKILDVPGVTKVEGTRRNDFYSGTMDALVNARIATADMFPGQPGRPVSAVTYRPVGQDKSEESWIWVPGYLTIHRRPSGQFRVAITVSRELQQSRKRAEEEGRNALVEPGVFLCLTPAIQRDFEAHHDMAHALDLDRRGRRAPLEVADQVLQYVTQRLQRRHEMPRGLPRAFESLQQGLSARIRREREGEERERAQAQQQQEQRVSRLRSLPATASEFRRRIAHKFQILIEQGLLPQMRAESGYRFTAAFVEDLVADMKASYFAILEADIEGVSPRVELARKDKGLQQFLAACADDAEPGVDE